MIFLTVIHEIYTILIITQIKIQIIIMILLCVFLIL